VLESHTWLKTINFKEIMRCHQQIVASKRKVIKIDNSRTYELKSRVYDM